MRDVPGEPAQVRHALYVKRWGVECTTSQDPNGVWGRAGSGIDARIDSHPSGDGTGVTRLNRADVSRHRGNEA